MNSLGQSRKRQMKPRKLARSIPRSLGTFPLRVVRKLTTSALTVVNQAGQTGANTTYNYFDVASISPNLLGLTAYFVTGAGTGLYNNARLLAVKTRIRCSNQEAFSVRVAGVLTSTTPATNSLSSTSTQAVYMSRIASALVHETVGPLTGANSVAMDLQASLRSTLGVNVNNSVTDQYTNYWNSTTDSGVAATQGLSLILMVLSAVNLVSGVLFDVESELTIEFWGPNPTKTS